MTANNRLLAAAGALAALGLLAAACGGESRAEIVFEVAPQDGADIATLTAEVRDILERQSAAYGLENIRFATEGARMTASLPEAEADIARRLFAGPGQFELRSPVLDEAGNIICSRADSSTVAVPPESIEHVPAGNTFLPRCRLDEGEMGDITWETARPTDADGTQHTIDNAMIDRVWLDRTESPLVFVGLNPLGAGMLELLTREMEGYPLGIFMDNLVVAAPRIDGPITSGDVRIGGLTLRDSEILAAQLSAPPLPAPLFPINP
jgi:preprotein translocase subunit SecD